VKLAVKRTSAAIAVFATAGVSGLFLGAAPAFAVPSLCGTGTLISTNICEQTFTATTATNFTPPAQTTKLEALLVGGGGGGNVAGAFAPSITGYAVAGGGGEVNIVDFTPSVGSATPLVVTVGAGGSSESAGDTTTVTGGPAASASGGGGASTTTGGASGTNTGASISDSGSPATYYGGGAGAGPSGSATTIDGGAGATISTSFSGDPLFGSDPACYGGGGAALESPAVGTASCGGNAPSSDPADSSYPVVNANTGGGGAASLSVGSGGDGSDGVVVFRWFAPTYTLTFAADGHGTAPASQAVVQGSAPTRPADPTASGYVFEGWYADAALTTPADFSAPLTASTTFFAKWDPALPETGGGPNPSELPLAIGTLTLGAGLVGIALYRRKRKVTS
jgi:uncharacterized repeat protein (TIGR02543 family)